jgi:predicted RNase H-like nuclease (RuvC/YqgF family)
MIAGIYQAVNDIFGFDKPTSTSVGDKESRGRQEKQDLLDRIMILSSENGKLREANHQLGERADSLVSENKAIREKRRAMVKALEKESAKVSELERQLVGEERYKKEIAGLKRQTETLERCKSVVSVGVSGS